MDKSKVKRFLAHGVEIIQQYRRLADTCSLKYN